MIQAGSLIGFGLLFLVVTWAGSALFGAVLLAFRRRLRRAGPLTERALASAALIAPPLASATLVFSLAVTKLLQAAPGDGDHCTTHGHHLHLCLRHGGDWSENTAAVISLFFVAGVVVAGVVRRLRAYRATSGLLRKLERHGVTHPDLPPEARLVPSEIPLCVTAGLRQPRILISTASWALLAPEERQAVLAHEQAHIEHGDTRWRFALSMLGAFGLPGLGPSLLAVWVHASERICDWRASFAVEEPTVVAQALVRLARAASTARAPRIAETLAFTSPDAIGDRVAAILDAEPDGASLARKTAISLAVAAVAYAAVVALLASPLHHVFETLIHFN